MSVTKTQSGRGGSASKPPVATGAGSRGGGFGNRLKDYWQTLVYEWRKITWPDKKQWKDSTIVVFVFTILMMIVLAAFDWGVGSIMNTILGLRPAG